MQDLLNQFKALTDDQKLAFMKEAMPLMAFCFMGGGGIGTAIGSEIIKAYGISNFFLVYGAALLCTLLLSFVLVRGPVVALTQGPVQEKPLNMETA